MKRNRFALFAALVMIASLNAAGQHEHPRVFGGGEQIQGAEPSTNSAVQPDLRPRRVGGRMHRGGEGLDVEPPMNLPRLKRIDGELRRLRSEFQAIQDRREVLMQQLDEHKTHFQEGGMSPVGVMAHHAINQILAQLHELVQNERNLVMDVARRIGMAMMTHHVWGPQLAEGASQTPPGRPALDQAEWVKRWREAEQRLEARDREGFAIVLAGEQLGRLVVEFARDRWAAAFESDEDGLQPHWHVRPANRDRDPRGRRHEMMGEPMREVPRGRWMDRLERLERRQQEFRDEIRRQQEAIDRLRMMLQAAEVDQPTSEE